MKRNISDLLDEIPEDEIRLEHSAPLSARQIKKRTISQINKKKTVSLRWLARVAAVAAVIAVLGVTAFAADNIVSEVVGEEGIEKLFGNFFGKPLTEKQEEIVEEIGTTGGDTTTNYGVTITPIAAMADDTLLYMQLCIEAPEGTVLPDITENGYYQFGYTGTYIDAGIGYCGMGSYSYRIDSVTPLNDSNPDDNIKEFVIEAECSGAMKFTDGITKKLVFESLWYHSEENPFMNMHKQNPNCCVKVLEGDFEVSFNIEYIGNKLELDTEDLILYNEEFDFTTTVNKLMITPLSVTREFVATEPNDADIFPTGGSVKIVMKDGSSFKVGEYSEYNFGVDEEFLRKSEMEKATGLNLTNLAGVGMQYKLDDPIELDDIDYIVYGGEHIIDVN